MPSVLNPIVDMYQTQLEASRRFAEVVFAGTEKIDRVMIDATHRAFTEQMNFVQAIAGARDSKGIANLQSTYFSHRPENAFNYQKEVVKVFAEVQSEIGRSMQDYIERLGVSVAASKSEMRGTAQGPLADTVFNPMAGMFSVWESALKEAVSIADRNIDAVRSRYESGAQAAANISQEAENAATKINDVSINLDEQMRDTMMDHSMAGKSTKEKTDEKKSHSGLKRK